jgi:hypothetical protein
VHLGGNGGMLASSRPAPASSPGTKKNLGIAPPLGTARRPRPPRGPQWGEAQVLFKGLAL